MEWYENLEQVRKDYIEWCLLESTPYMGDLKADTIKGAEEIFTEGWVDRKDPFTGKPLVDLPCFQRHGVREVIELPLDVVKDIVYDDHEEWETIKTEITGNWRHGDENTGIFRRVSDGKLFSISWRDSVKDTCEFEDCNYGPLKAKQVFPVSKIVIVYE